MNATNLPLQLTSFIGRERELAELQGLLATSRLVTLTGAGGSGKTRLALEAARMASGHFAAGAHFISLATITEPNLVISTIAQALGVSESPDRLLFDSLREHLQERQILLLLDNFEQVISAAPLLSELLSAAAELKLLVTSREALRLRGEREYPLVPLQLFSGEFVPGQASPDKLLQVPSIALFVERTQANRPEFQLTDENAAVVAEICARLDGLPLAIELAAARIKLLPPPALLTQLQESSLHLLTAGPRDLPARQRTLHATMRWSYDLLDPDEQRTFRALSMFVGGCTLEAASEVTSQHRVASSGQGPGRDRPAYRTQSPNVLDLLTSLINKSLVVQSEVDGGLRLTLLETIREFGREQLAYAGELETVQRAHALYYLSLVEEAEPHLEGAEHREWLSQLEREQDNLREALRWGFEHREENGQAASRSHFVLRLAGALWRYWYLRGRWAEGRRWLEQALAEASKETSSDPADMALRAKVLYGAATVIRRQNDLARARALCQQSVTLYRELGDKAGLLAALLQMIRIMDFQGDYKGLTALLAETWEIAEHLPDLPIKARAYAELSMIDVDSVRTGVAAGYAAESERIYRALKNPSGLANALFVQASIAEFEGDLARAEVLNAEAERVASNVEDEPLKGKILTHRIVADWQRGDYASARRQFEQFLDRPVGEGVVDARRFASTGQSSFLFGVLAAILQGQGLSIWAARVCGLIDSLGDPSHLSSMMLWEILSPYRKQIADVRTEIRDQLGERAFEEALVEGGAMTLEDLLAIPQPQVAGTEAAASPFHEPLTPREVEVLRLLAQELSNPQIADRLVVSRRTVDAHLRSIYDKLDVHSRDAAVRVAIENELLDDEPLRK